MKEHHTIVKDTLSLALSGPIVVASFIVNAITLAEFSGFSVQEPVVFLTLLGLATTAVFSTYLPCLFGHRWPKWLVLALTPLSLHFYLLPDAHFASPPPFENIQFWLGTFALGANLLCFTIFTRMQGFWPPFYNELQAFREMLNDLESGQKERDSF